MCRTCPMSGSRIFAPSISIATCRRRKYSPIGRRYCGAKVLLSDGQDRDIWYLIEEGQGFVGIGDNVEFCVSGFDRWYVYNGRCRILR